MCKIQNEAEQRHCGGTDPGVQSSTEKRAKKGFPPSQANGTCFGAGEAGLGAPSASDLGDCYRSVRFVNSLLVDMGEVCARGGAPRLH